jgi:hypothetical protein
VLNVSKGRRFSASLRTHFSPTATDSVRLLVHQQAKRRRVKRLSKRIGLCPSLFGSFGESTRKHGKKERTARWHLNCSLTRTEIELEIGSLLRANHPKGWDAKPLA